MFRYPFQSVVPIRGMSTVPSAAVRRLYRPGVTAVLAVCALVATAANLPHAVPLIALSALSAIACVVPHR